jgi:hypothetical protein
MNGEMSGRILPCRAAADHHAPRGRVGHTGTRRVVVARFVAAPQVDTRRPFQ